MEEPVPYVPKKRQMMTIRMRPEEYDQFKLEAVRERKTLNRWVMDLMKERREQNLRQDSQRRTV